MAKKKLDDALYTPRLRRAFLKEAIKALHTRTLFGQSERLRSNGWTPAIGVRGLVIATGSRTKWEEADVQQKMDWVWELEKLGLATIKPSRLLPDTQPRQYYVVTLTDYSMEEAYNIIEQS